MTILLIGLGRFGKHLAMKFRDMKHEVLAIDAVEERVNEVLPYVTNAQIGDSTNEQFIASLGVRNFDLCVVAIGDNFQSSLETTSLLKENGAKFVVSRASRDVHAKFLLRNGADDVVYPERQMADWASVRYTMKNVSDYFELMKGHAVFHVALPHSWIGKSIIELNVRRQFKVNILAVRNNNEWNPLPNTDYVFSEGETLWIMGDIKDVAKFTSLK